MTRHLWLRAALLLLAIADHKVLQHGSALLAAFELPIGFYSEEPQEANSKVFRKSRSENSRMCCRKKTNIDIMRHMLLSSDPLISSLRMNDGKRKEVLSKKAKTLLLDQEIDGARCLRDVSLEVVPEAVQRGQEAILRCHYDLEKAPLYSLKWYRGRHEFYRFSPSEDPVTKIFNISGIYVDLANSNKSQVTLRNVDFGLSGTFSCEVTADAPTFSTAFVSKNLTVVSLPEGKPVIVSERDRYEPGDTLRANCSLPPSKPPAHLSFTVNNLPVESTTRQQHQRQAAQQAQQLNRDREGYNEIGSPQSSEINLTLQPFHYVNGQLNLRCTAQIPGIYTSTSEVQLGSGLREPVPERVTLDANGSEGRALACLAILCVATLHLLVR